ncbi:molybdate ABC transporter substrate-binding protein [Alkalicoccobacillus porphyridii]|uniref:Molybdate ABC transporter substrate-binding protein n=1 Tax=Alkalicoccobacillus porphyridii TaxID=2597270 RepID=A0A553ZWX7_9BACI|nr:molybdate ABC transporter substrate-binding protein [Alkalicoccobacillus porphyridii]TSB45968.1 molybdate ABC transporter substrate-binding protein [Alkalicoccobacillus porphyridii]
MKKWTGLIGLGFLLAGCGSANEEATDIHIMAAASLTDALGEIKEHYEQEHQVNLVINYGSSGKLREQISQGAPADIFLSASLSDMETLEADGEVSESVHALKNQLVMISTPEAAEGLSEWQDITNDDIQGIAMGQPDSVPAGRYSLEALENQGIWEEIQDRVVYGTDVRQVLTYVETGNTDVGLVYQTDALSSDQIEIIDTAPEQSHEPIIYPIGLLTNAEENESAEAFYQYLQTEDAQTVFEAYGFERGE